MTPTSGARRLVRVVALGGTSLLLAAGAHLVGGGRLPSVGVLSVCALLLGLVALVITVRRVRLPALVVLLGVEQTLLHLVFDAATVASRGGSVLAGSVGHGAGHSGFVLNHLVAGGSLPAAGMGAVGMGATMVAPGWLMWAGHLTATVLTAWLLARGEAWLWRVADRFVAAATAAPAACLVSGRRIATAGVSRCAPTATPYSPATPRGPPVLSGT